MNQSTARFEMEKKKSGMYLHENKKMKGQLEELKEQVEEQELMLQEKD